MAKVAVTLLPDVLKETPETEDQEAGVKLLLCQTVWLKPGEGVVNTIWHTYWAIDAFAPGKYVEGTVTFISPVAEFTPKNVQTKEERTKLVFGVRIEISRMGFRLIAPVASSQRTDVFTVLYAW